MLHPSQHTKHLKTLLQIVSRVLATLPLLLRRLCESHSPHPSSVSHFREILRVGFCPCECNRDCCLPSSQETDDRDERIGDCRSDGARTCLREFPRNAASMKACEHLPLECLSRFLFGHTPSWSSCYRSSSSNHPSFGRASKILFRGLLAWVQYLSPSTCFGRKHNPKWLACEISKCARNACKLVLESCWMLPISLPKVNPVFT